MRLLHAALCVCALLAFAAAPALGDRTYTVNIDFDEGTLTGVEHDTVADQLQLSAAMSTLPFIWVPNQNGSISKVDTGTGKEMGRYYVSPASRGATAPSRTTVDLNGNCWVGVRYTGTAVQVGLEESGQNVGWIDRNGNGVCDTCHDANNNGHIEASEMLQFGQDECVLYEVLLTNNANRGVYAPGTIPTANYDTNYWGTAPRGLAIDANNDLWVGTWDALGTPTCQYHEVGLSGGAMTIKQVVDCNTQAYGAVIDDSGILWGASLANNHVFRMDTNNPTDQATLNLGRQTYGLGLAGDGNLYVAGWTNNRLGLIDTDAPKPGSLVWDKSGPNEARGVAVTSDGDVWVASTGGDRVYRYDHNGTLKTSIYVGDGPTGVAVDANGKVWACNLYDDTIVRIDPSTNSVDMTVHLYNSGGHYSYSDMTGIVARSITTKTGDWEVVYDSGTAGTPWGGLSWNGFVPTGTEFSVLVSSSEDGVTWSAPELATSGGALSSTPAGRYLKIKANFKILSGDVSPILYDLTAQVVPVPAAAGLGLLGLGLVGWVRRRRRD